MALLLGHSAGTSAEELKIGGTGTALRTMQLLAAEFTARNLDLHIKTVPGLGSSGGIRAVVAGAINLAVTSRPMTASEHKLGAVETEYARTPFVFAVSTKSKVSAITLKDLANLYAGRQASWADGTPVRIVLRPPSDVDAEMTKSLSPELRQAIHALESRPTVQFSINDQDAADDLERVPGSIGPTSLALILSEKRALRPLALEGKAPSLSTSALETYPYHKHLYFVTGTKPTVAVEQFIAFVNSPVGRKILASNGHLIP
ncbi:MAG: substrate-binding domain-containing protein [Proteobacteria bacterium]|nr:substrate-binding domain-containing protein [Pseudomonadota bacterium]